MESPASSLNSVCRCEGVGGACMEGLMERHGYHGEHA